MLFGSTHNFSRYNKLIIIIKSLIKHLYSFLPKLCLLDLLGIPYMATIYEKNIQIFYNWMNTKLHYIIKLIHKKLKTTALEKKARLFKV
jgi:hypothetical protein